MSNREILFRGKRVDNGEWIEGFYVEYGFTNKEKPYIVPSFASALYGFEVIPETVGQFTGLTDKNGKKIFEGDIIHLKDTYAVIKYGEYPNQGNTDDMILGFYTEDEETTASIAFAYLGEKLVNVVDVAGNIHDNPELLGGEASHVR